MDEVHVIQLKLKTKSSVEHNYYVFYPDEKFSEPIMILSEFLAKRLQKELNRELQKQ